MLSLFNEGKYESDKTIPKRILTKASQVLGH